MSAQELKTARANAKRALTKEVNNIRQCIAEDELDNLRDKIANLKTFFQIFHHCSRGLSSWNDPTGGEMIGFLNMPKVELEVSSGDQYLLFHADEMLSPTYEIATALMSYEWVSKSSVWDNYRPETIIFTYEWWHTWYDW